MFKVNNTLTILPVRIQIIYILAQTCYQLAFRGLSTAGFAKAQLLRTTPCSGRANASLFYNKFPITQKTAKQSYARGERMRALFTINSYEINVTRIRFC